MQNGPISFTYLTSALRLKSQLISVAFAIDLHSATVFITNHAPVYGHQYVLCDLLCDLLVLQCYLIYHFFPLKPDNNK